MIMIIIKLAQFSCLSSSLSFLALLKFLHGLEPLPKFCPPGQTDFVAPLMRNWN